MSPKETQALLRGWSPCSLHSRQEGCGQDATLSDPKASAHAVLAAGRSEPHFLGRACPFSWWEHPGCCEEPSTPSRPSAPSVTLPRGSQREKTVTKHVETTCDASGACPTWDLGVASIGGWLPSTSKAGAPAVVAVSSSSSLCARKTPLLKLLTS